MSIRHLLTISNFVTGVVVALVPFTVSRYWSIQQNTKDGILSPQQIRDAYALCSRTPFSQSSALFYLKETIVNGRLYDGELENGSIWAKGTWSVDIANPDINILRSYTPLPPSQDLDHLGPRPLELLIRKEPGGEMSNFLNRLRSGMKLRMRGPFTDYELPHDVAEVVFLAGGTGIAPAMQIAYAIGQRRTQRCAASDNSLTQPTDGPSVRMSILWANRRAADAYSMYADDHPGRLVKQIEQMGQAPGLDLELKVFIDEQGTFIKDKDLSSVLSRPSPSVGKRIIIISGPQGLVEFLAGSKAQPHAIDVHHGGVPGGLLSKVDLRGWDVVKLRT